MANAKASKQSFLPPRCPFPIAPTSYVDHQGQVGLRVGRDGYKHHQRTSSESFLLEEQPSWLEDLLNEPETQPAWKAGAHRRSSSDSFTFFDGLQPLDSQRHEPPAPRETSLMSSWMHSTPYYPEAGGNSSFGRQQQLLQQSKGWDAPPVRPTSSPAVKEMVAHHHGSLSTASDHTSVGSLDGFDDRRKQEAITTGQEPKIVGIERKDFGITVKPAVQVQSEADSKRAKQQYAQRSRVRKLQYIAELERRVQALQAEGIEVSSEIDFIGQQNIMLDLENKALKQRLDSLAQEQVIKRFQQEMFEREVARLRLLYQQQVQQQLQPIPSHGHSNSRDLDSQFANLSLKPKDPNSAYDPISGPLLI